ncbi:hypothetical protein [Inhella crocodyli]|uniref:Uncharacterized protein n=1 Tax=Inhella crocodyli TaxID=2499851 RepID=A0A3S2VJG6_9BURK|nr:hypothetical protein [Inhella crocodyli]RVT88749.1 hypothetical protein EOD73_07215 [Inhella crocodyli]
MTPSLKFRYRRLAALTLALLALSACGGSAEESAAPSPLISARSDGHIPVLRTPAATVCNRCQADSRQFTRVRQALASSVVPNRSVFDVVLHLGESVAQQVPLGQ